MDIPASRDGLYPPCMPIHTWSVRDRPRERLRRVGPGALSDRELVAILVGSGGREASALDVASAILAAGRGSLRALAEMDASRLEAVPGVGPATAARVRGALELGRRWAAEEHDDGPAIIRGPRDVYELVGPDLRDLPQEEFHVLLLDTRHRVLRREQITRGTLDASLIHPREVFRLAIVERAAGIVLVHNHPSGDPAPSPEDRAVTRQLADAGRAVGIPVLDHVIVGDGSFRSLTEDGIL